MKVWAFKQKNQAGFTIVELLIVIVIIAILAAITIVAYNGIQQRARNASVQQSASQLDKKVMAWRTINGSYPSAASVAAGLNGVPEAEIEQGLADLIITNADPTEERPIAYKTCAGYVGSEIMYLVEGGGTNVMIAHGDCPAGW